MISLHVYWPLPLHSKAHTQQWKYIIARLNYMYQTEQKSVSTRHKSIPHKLTSLPSNFPLDYYHTFEGTIEDWHYIVVQLSLNIICLLKMQYYNTFCNTITIHFVWSTSNKLWINNGRLQSGQLEYMYMHDCIDNHHQYIDLRTFRAYCSRKSQFANFANNEQSMKFISH